MPQVSADEEGKAEEFVNEQLTSVTTSQRQEAGVMPQNSQTSAREVIETENGLVNKDVVRRIMQQNIPPDAPAVKMISSNQTQEYFAVATQTGFEIIQNDSSSEKIKKKI